ncbi:hypothetical protein KUV85_06080 [Nocardioides panacisoli]|uniref:hypothetical protein n=1 Tax=Nocardioides panacisoli TaxID=627624 RepID=UPI001C628BA9|nr:hypothetical protein [Nocardioides panacisoli]QYJ05242.1 hypothetical protein KUV85_06080 [Nocardioides panacisoli]
MRSIGTPASAALAAIVLAGCGTSAPTADAPSAGGEPSPSRTSTTSEGEHGESVTSPWTVFRTAGNEVEHYDSLRGMIGKANATALGTVEDVEPIVLGEEREGNAVETYVNVSYTVRIDEFMGGELASAEDGTFRLEFGPVDPADYDAIAEQMVGDQAWFALRRWGSDVPRDVWSEADRAAHERGAYRIVNSQGLVDDAGSAASFAVNGDRPEPWMADIESEGFDEFLAMARDLADR